MENYKPPGIHDPACEDFLDFWLGGPPVGLSTDFVVYRDCVSRPALWSGLLHEIKACSSV